MAQDVRTKVYLGYEDEYVTEKHRSLLNFTTNKIGGKPDWHNDQMTLIAPQCRLCGLHQLLALQIYAPLENSKYHRSLYIFACMNPNCWNQNESWTCLRVQSQEQAPSTDSLSSSCATVQTSATSWLADADDWGDNWNDNVSERNGNNLMLNDPNKFSLSAQNTNYEEELKADFSELQVDDPNANSPTSVESPVGVGAVGRLDSPHASAEIEGEESEVVCIDTPTQPRCDLISLLQEVTPLPVQHTESKAGKSLLNFTEIFISVDEESQGGAEVPQHVRDLFLEYQRSNGADVTAGQEGETSDDSKAGYDGGGMEKYEKGIPKHGDEMFHNFVSRIQKNPGQILRYARDNAAPLLLYPMGGCIGRCRHCGDEMTFELQILPTLIPKLKLNTRSDRHFQLEYGTILVFTCIRSCWSATDSYREEHVIVQAERL
ncbi:programmed cell death protein 2-like [Nasonia vitripennis]|uniref:Programmed cell death protein 2 C-terminal domain-containing protein n=1 Tax=Nasonia vitripennis TaxID=7425 RepID=A0A7M7H465_NASVI|nr:programmed cell death protein 2-like [Nasonia vitripennis]XP_008205254.1 programmed cell death protein 2-like [Nasonia vitripennis]XP_032453918.1 programmed cell death protein 2-like [Nasonia vitripennis]